MATRKQTVEAVIKSYEIEITELKAKLAGMSVVGVHAVLPGDTWYYPKNRKNGFAKSAWLNIVVRVNKRQNRVEFSDGGWNPLSDMLRKNSGWYLLGRVYKEGMEDKVKT